MLIVKNVTGGYPGHKILENVSFSVASGELFGILGPNGSGKTTLLKIISGLLKAEQGEVLINNQPLENFTSKELARNIAVLPQVSSEVFAYTVKETVSLGRYAHQRGLLSSRSQKDEQAIREAMQVTGIEKFQNKLLHELSGGERQRVFLAQALAQEPKILLLDEPTNHLDLSFQKELLDQLMVWARQQGLAIVSIFHDLNIASLYCDRLLLLHHGTVSALGSVDEVLKEKRIQDVYETMIEKQPHPKVPKPQMVLLPSIVEKVDEQPMTISEKYIEVTENNAVLKSPIPLKVMATTELWSGIGWKRTFIQSFNPVERDSLPEETILLGTGNSGPIRYGTYEQIFILLVAGMEMNSCNIIIFVNGILSDEGFIRGIMAVSEAQILTTGRSNKGAVIIASTQSGSPLAIDKMETLIHRGLKEQIGQI
ncbi:ABC transporter ATP-binding protein [Bacillus niameyensis]|uniref:ABC transporter ATP-binding protein n=1 Tax=Bacillus niameyensis TaxID=1522308 RepID=UPI0007853C9B|nr:ATP-binding cassette domain-containing protein [Bacillus niameyensis]